MLDPFRILGTGRSRIIKQSLSPAYAVPPQRVVFTVEYEIGPTCNGTCEGIWTFVNGPDTVFDGRYDNVSGTINASSPTAAYAYVETEWLTPNRRLSRLVIPTVCDKNTGIFTFAIPDSTTSPASFDLRVEFPRAREVSPEEVGKGSDDTALRGRFLKNRVYEISCSTPGFLGAANLTSRLEFVYAKPPMYCLKNATVERLDYPVDGFLQELNGKRSLSRKCISPGVLSPDGKPTYFSRFTVRADRSARVSHGSSSDQRRFTGSRSRFRYFASSVGRPLLKTVPNRTMSMYHSYKSRSWIDQSFSAAAMTTY